jgi:four helix bundle protein
MKKLQAPTSKLQRNSKLAKSIGKGGVYPDGEFVLRVVSDETMGERHPFDLEERTALFGEAIVRFLKQVPRGPHNDRLIDQLTGCGTAIGANYCEANEGLSKKDFRNIIGRCRKEAKETKYFLRMIASAEPTLAPAARVLFREAKELHLIFCAIYRNSAL